MGCRRGYFDATAVVVTLIMVWHLLERRARSATGEAIKKIDAVKRLPAEGHIGADAGSLPWCFGYSKSCCAHGLHQHVAFAWRRELRATFSASGA